MVDWRMKHMANGMMRREMKWMMNWGMEWLVYVETGGGRDDGVLRLEE